jgi:hypothetical protein
MACSALAHLPLFLHINYSPLPYFAILKSRRSHTPYRHTPYSLCTHLLPRGGVLPHPEGPMCVQGNLPKAGYYLYVSMRVCACGVCATCLYTYTIIRIPGTGAPQDEPGGCIVQDSALHKVTAGHPLR